jgi:hypothetical protein
MAVEGGGIGWSSPVHFRAAPRRNLARSKHARRTMGHAWHLTSQPLVLDPLLQPVGWHGPACEAARSVAARWAARPISGPAHSGHNSSSLEYYCDHVSSIQILWSSYFVNLKISVKIKYLTAFLLTVYSWHDGPNGHTSTAGQMGRPDSNKGMACRAWADLRHVGQRGTT